MWLATSQATARSQRRRTHNAHNTLMDFHKASVRPWQCRQRSQPDSICTQGNAIVRRSLLHPQSQRQRRTPRPTWESITPTMLTNTKAPYQHHGNVHEITARPRLDARCPSLTTPTGLTSSATPLRHPILAPTTVAKHVLFQIVRSCERCPRLEGKSDPGHRRQVCVV